MHLPKFTYIRLSSRTEASRLLKDYGAEAKLVSGGTDLYPRMKYGLVRPRIVISLKDLPIESPHFDANGDMCLDASMSMADVASNHELRGKFPLLTDAAFRVASNQIRNMATLGGNICLENRCLYYNQAHIFQFSEPCFKRKGNHCYLAPKGKKCFAVFMADTVPALISLNAVVTVAEEGKTRSLSLEELYSGDALQPLNLKPGEILTKVVIPHQSSLQGTAFVKFSLRGGMEFAVLNLAVVLKVKEDRRTCKEARLTAGAISSAPVRLKKAESALRGMSLASDLFRDIASIAASEVVPLPHHGYSSAYLKKCLEVEVRRALEAAFYSVK